MSRYYQCRWCGGPIKGVPLVSTDATHAFLYCCEECKRRDENMRHHVALAQAKLNFGDLEAKEA